MSAVCRDFVVAGENDDAALAAVDALTPRFELAVGDWGAIRRTWLDTFDWRLHQAGLVLEHNEAPGAAWLTLTADGSERLTCRVTALRWPLLVDRLPAGPLRERVARVVGIRALSPIATGESTVRHVQVLDDEAKTVARVVVDRLIVDGDPAERPVAHLSVVGLRGYGAERDRVAGVLSRAPGVTTAGSVYEHALRWANNRPQDAAKKAGANLIPSMSAAAAIASVLESFLAVLQANAPGVIADVDTEFLHDFRVAVRRTRATLKLAGDVLPGVRTEQFAGEFKWLGDLTTPTRDLDVFLLGFGEMAGRLQAADAADLEPFHAYLARCRSLELRRLVRALRSRRFARLLADWRSELASVERNGPDPLPGLTARELAEQRVGKAYRRVVKHGTAITDDSPAEQLHELRKRCKELRYLMEIFSVLQDPSAHDRVVRELKALQECLGDFQDSEVQRRVVGHFATQMMSEAVAPAETVLAMGELAALLDAHQRRARNDYAGRFGKFMRRRNRLAMAQITATSEA